MFEKFFGACTITLGLYLCLTLSSVVPSSSKVLMFQVSQVEPTSEPTLQESIKFKLKRFSHLNSSTKINPGIIAY